jgi:hypothetical protein
MPLHPDKENQMPDEMKPATRRGVLLAGAAGGLILLARPQQARAQGTLPQKDAKYQETPKGAQSCAVCSYFVPGATAKAAGGCKVVAGAISPTAWCVLFAPKPH